MVGGGGGVEGESALPEVFSSITSKCYEILKRNFLPLILRLLTVILHILSVTILIRCFHGILLFSVCHIIVLVGKTKKLELF